MTGRTTPRSHRRGTVIVIVVVLLLVAAAIAGSIFQAVRLDVRQFPADRRSLQADRLAEAGLARAMAASAANPSYEGEEWRPDLPDGETGVVSIRVNASADGRAVSAIATFPASGDRPARARRANSVQ